MLEFIQLLKQRYQSVITQLDNKNPRYLEYQQCIEQLVYAEAFIRNSSAGVSPLAGYTVHPQGFCHDSSLEACSGLQYYFGRFQQLEPVLLSRDRLDCYALSTSNKRSDVLPACVLWDTPDFDSIDAGDYREGVIRTVALADLVVLVVSKEKYADQSVWELMKTIEPFGQPTLICLNKLAEGSESLVLASLEQKWRQSRRDPMPTVISMLFQKQTASPIWPENAQRTIFKLAKRVQPNTRLNNSNF